MTQSHVEPCGASYLTSSKWHAISFVCFVQSAGFNPHLGGPPTARGSLGSGQQWQCIQFNFKMTAHVEFLWSQQ